LIAGIHVTNLTHLEIDHSVFSFYANARFSEQALEDFKTSLGPLGKWDSFTGQSLRGGMVGRTYIVRFANKTIRAWTLRDAGRKLEQFQVAVGN
jgi:D-alanyl-D-alanine carboxypeptidase